MTHGAPSATRLIALVLFVLAGCASTGAARPPATASFLLGVDANYLPELEARGVNWSEGGRVIRPLEVFARQGVDAFRLRLWTGNGDTALALAEEAERRGMDVLPVIFLSEDWADYVKQPAPAAWRGMLLEGKAAAARAHARAVAIALRDRGIRCPYFAVGNEIDFGICGEFEERWERRFAMEWMRKEIWPRAAAVIVAAQEGVLEVDPRARFVVHLAQWWSPDYVRAMIETLKANGVRLDAVGLSYYPSAPMGEEQDPAAFFRNAETLAEAFDCPVIVCETAFPATPEIGGQFSSWNRAVPGHEFTPEGQRRWIADFLEECRRRPVIAGAFYWSPEWHGGGLWDAFALFDERGVARPGLGALGAGAGVPPANDR